jgi:hypothetical protein
MPAAEPSVDSPSAETDGFLALAMREVRAAAGKINAYAAVLDAQIAQDSSLDALREIVRELRGQADVVAALMDSATE